MSRFTRDEFEVGSTITKLQDVYKGFDAKFATSTKETVDRIVTAYKVFQDHVDKLKETPEERGGGNGGAGAAHSQKGSDKTQKGGSREDELTEDKGDMIAKIKSQRDKLKTYITKINENINDQTDADAKKLKAAIGELQKPECEWLTDAAGKLSDSILESENNTPKTIDNVVEEIKEFKSFYFPKLIKYTAQIENEISVQEKEKIESKTKFNAIETRISEKEAPLIKTLEGRLKKAELKAKEANDKATNAAEADKVAADANAEKATEAVDKAKAALEEAKSESEENPVTNQVEVYSKLESRIEELEKYLTFLTRTKSEYEDIIQQFETSYKKLIEYLTTLKTILEDIKEKKDKEEKENKRNAPELEEIKDENGDLITIFEDSKITKGTKQSSSKNIKNENLFEDAYKKLIKEINNHVSDLFTQYLEKYLHGIHKKVNYLKRAERGIQKRLQTAGSEAETITPENARLARKYATDMKDIKEMSETIEKSDRVVEAAIYKLYEAVKAAAEGIRSYDYFLIDDIKKIALVERCEDMVKRVTKVQQKLKDVYNNDISIMDIILDNQFLALYVLKLLQFGLLVGAIFLTEKIFSNMYMERVYANNGDPPDLMIMLAICIAIYTAFTLFLATVLFLIHLIVEKHGIRNFVINVDLIKKYLIDYAASTLLLFILLSIICSYMQSKKYFRYKTEGLRAIRAFGDIIMSIAPVVFLVPYFALF